MDLLRLYTDDSDLPATETSEISDSAYGEECLSRISVRIA
jgi:hypothetical protein